MDFETFKATFKVGDTFYYTDDDFDVVKPIVVKCILKEVADDHIIFENDVSDHNRVDAEDIEYFRFRKTA